MYELYRELVVKTTREKAWEFIRSPGNLNKITPDDLSFEIVSDLPDEMFEGMLVEYRVNIPVIGKQEWVSELQHIVPGYSFVDEQKIGPYKLWYHYHGIEEIEGCEADRSGELQTAVRFSGYDCECAVHPKNARKDF